MYSKSIIKQVWDKGTIVDGYEKDLYRKDAAGAWIAFNSYGNKGSVFGWDIDHVWPIANGGGEDMINLRPLHLKNIEAKKDDYPVYLIELKAVGDHNERVHESRTVNEKLQSILNDLYGKRG
jgi:hypothetical protein